MIRLSAAAAEANSRGLRLALAQGAPSRSGTTAFPAIWSGCTRLDSLKFRLIARAGRFTLLVQRTSPTMRYVSVEGRVTSTAATTEDQVRAMARRYLPEHRVEAYVESFGHEHAIWMRPEHWLSADLGPT